MRLRTFQVLCGVLGAVWVLVGLALFAGFFRFHAPGGEGFPMFPMGPNGHYFAAFAGCALVAWGGCLIGAARRPGEARSVGTATALGLVLSGLYRMLAWVMGDYAQLGALPRVEAAVMLAVALAVLWLRPAPTPSQREA
jgi:hypothetical protein